MYVASIYIRVFALRAARFLELGCLQGFFTWAGDKARECHAECFCMQVVGGSY
jgi:hypothetical protein